MLAERTGYQYYWTSFGGVCSHSLVAFPLVNEPSGAVGCEMHVEPRTTARKGPTFKRQPVAAAFRSACACSQIAADNRDAIRQLQPRDQTSWAAMLAFEGSEVRYTCPCKALLL